MAHPSLRMSRRRGQVIPVSMQMQRALAPPRVAIYNRPRVRAVSYQFALLAALVWLGYEFALNAKANLDAQKITSEIGRASCRERVEISVVAGSLKKKKRKIAG